MGTPAQEEHEESSEEDILNGHKTHARRAILRGKVRGHRGKAILSYCNIPPVNYFREFGSHIQDAKKKSQKKNPRPHPRGSTVHQAVHQAAHQLLANSNSPTMCHVATCLAICFAI